MIQETPRLLLRLWHMGDAEAIYRYASGPAVGYLAGWAVHKSVAESIDVIKTSFQNYTTPFGGVC